MQARTSNASTPLLTSLRCVPPLREQKAELKEMFKIIDRDRNGELTVSVRLAQQPPPPPLHPCP